eukprot:jgi/Mesen1/4055/ME000213S03080
MAALQCTQASALASLAPASSSSLGNRKCKLQADVFLASRVSSYKRAIVKCQASEQQAQEGSQDFSRRELFANGTGAALSLAALSAASTVAEPVLAADDVSEWEKIDLPVNPGIVLLDVAFVPNDPNHGFLLGTRQTLLETKDGGRSWAAREIPSAEDEDFNYRFNCITFEGNEGWIVGKPAILLHTSNAGESWERVPLSSRLPGTPVSIKATGAKSAEMVTDEGAIYVTSNGGYNWKAAVEETAPGSMLRAGHALACCHLAENEGLQIGRGMSSLTGISGASYYTGTFNTVNRSPGGDYVAVSSRGNFYLTWEPGQAYWQPHNRTSARRIQNMGWRADGGLWLLVRGGGLFLNTGTSVSEDFQEVRVPSRGFGILDVGFRSEKEAWAAGGSGVLLKTTDGGKSWVRDRVADNLAANLYAVKFVDSKQGFVLGNDGLLLRYVG